MQNDSGDINNNHRNNDPFATVLNTSSHSSEQDMPTSPPTLTTIMATPTTPSLPSLPSFPFSSSPPLTYSYPSPCSPLSPASLSPPTSSKYYNDNNGHNITSPQKSDSTPIPSSSITSSELAHLIEKSVGSAGSRRPLILDLRPNPDFHPISISRSININLPTLLMRRYRRGAGSVSSFALESFITMPSDKDVYHQILDSWRTVAESSDEPHDIVVLDQDMEAGNEEYGRSATAAWTLLNVLERGGGNNCFGGAPIRLWYLEGGFESFQAWDFNEKYLVRSGSSGHQQQDDQDVEMTLAAPVEMQTSVSSKKPALSINTSVAFEPKQKAPARRESLFSLDTKSLQRPAGLGRSQTVNLSPLIIPSPNNTSNLQQPQQQPKGSWLTVPASTSSCLSPTMSMVSNHSMEISHSASTDHSPIWSADSSSVNGSGHFPPSASAGLNLTLNKKRSMSSLLTINTMHTSNVSIREKEGEEEHSQMSHNSSSHWSNDSLKDSNGSFSTQISDSCSEDDENMNASEQEISCILPNFLYLGPEILHQSQVVELDRLGVKRILNMATECEDLLVSNREGMEYHKIGVHDHIEADVGAGLLKAVDIISASADSPIYVHCKAGKSRSVTATIAYLITQLHWPLNKAYQHVLQQRPCMCPNIGFVTELIRIEELTLGADKSGGIYGA
ncbi:hypothetical protein BGX27_007555 [Mortierella sp. AM989]|nr:hypothetical protein BGX27_007555 [Mortierella sp. AM989]